MYKSTIGVSLHVVETLDIILGICVRVLRIKTLLSEAMNFVTHEMMKGKKLSEAVGEVATASETTGTSMVAKIVVLARLLGVHISASAVQLEPLIPQSRA